MAKGNKSNHQKPIQCKLGHEFTPDNTYITPKTGRRQCRLCRAAIAKMWYKQHPRQRREHYRKHFWSKNYGITPEQVQQMYEQQGGKCSICKKILDMGASREVQVDHDHRTGKIRSLLCKLCNMGLGLFNDNTNTMQAAIEYVRNHATS